jgi:Flp pilus assembly protein protease CpaA
MIVMKLPVWAIVLIFFLGGTTGSLISKIDVHTTWIQVLSPFFVVSGISGGVMSLIALLHKSPLDKNNNGVPDDQEEVKDNGQVNSQK